MIKEVKMFTVRCDNCGKRADQEVEYSCWESPESARLMAEYDEWVEVESKQIKYEIKIFIVGYPCKWIETTLDRYSAYNDANKREIEVIVEKDYCPECVSYDDYGNLRLEIISKIC